MEVAAGERKRRSFGIILRVFRPRASTLVLMTGPLVAIVSGAGMARL
jgi:hypothetical protein